jgi:hypothetical protein
MLKHSSLVVALAIVFTVTFKSNTEAASWNNAAGIKAVAENYSPIEKVQAAGNACPTGFTWGCRGGVCKCRTYR